MRMWKVNPKNLCRKHLLGEHVEMHMFIGTIKRGTRLTGYIKKGLVEVHNIINRHDKLADEMITRGYKHNSDISKEDINLLWKEGFVDKNKNEKVLANRCKNWRK